VLIALTKISPTEQDLSYGALHRYSMWQQLQRWFKPANAPLALPNDTPGIWTVDMHNHLIPGVDDGVKTLEDSMICLRQYADWGIRRVICTPHISQDYYPNTAEELLEAVKLVQDAIADEQLPIDLSVAAEYLLDEQFDQLMQEEKLLSFGPARYVLIETGWASAPYQLDQSLFQMQLKGYTPILAHPERYTYYQQEPYRLRMIQEQGCLLQLNLMSLVGRYGKGAQQLATTLLQEHAISFVSSDLHRPADLPILQSVFSTSAWQQLHEQPLRLNEIL
jgi:tyrosine-protein phosphatase YwqE